MLLCCAVLQVEMAALQYQLPRLVRAQGPGSGRAGFGVGGATTVVSARQRGHSGSGETAWEGGLERISYRPEGWWDWWWWWWWAADALSWIGGMSGLPAALK